jgi:hypothetical protein
MILDQWPRDGTIEDGTAHPVGRLANTSTMQHAPTSGSWSCLVYGAVGPRLSSRDRRAKAWKAPES